MIMEKVVDQQITAEEARKWLSNVVRLERNKIEKLKMLRRFDSRDPEDDLRHDNATKSAWKHISVEGLHAPLPPEMADSWLLQQNLDIIRADLGPVEIHRELMIAAAR
ncbi:hypothetical protein [Pseudorhodobacter sp.]|nr:hypothetical protein [Pseudorhodobacter sp.]